jgi:hypothetical protein
MMLAAVVTLVTTAVHARLVSVRALASSPVHVAHGKVWLLLMNGTVVQRPVLLSLLSFALLSLFALFFCGARIFVWAALVGHVGSTLLSYSLVAAMVVVDAGATRGVLRLPDYGVSAMQAAWIGAIAAQAWRRRGQTTRGRLLVAAGCLAIACFACAVRHDLTLLDVDHVFAFAIGIGLVVRWGRRDSEPLAVAARSFASLLVGSACGVASRQADVPPWSSLNGREGKSASAGRSAASLGATTVFKRV